MPEHAPPVRQIRGPAAIAAALDAREPLGLVLVHEDAKEEGVDAVVARARAQGIPVRVAAARVLERMTSVGSPSDVLALAGRDPAAGLDAVAAGRGALWLLVGLAYPSNAGMAIRTAEGSGADGIVIDADWDHQQRRTALRTSMRADWYMPVLWERAEAVLERARAAGRTLFGVENTGSDAPWDADLTVPALFVVGGEADGVAPDLLERCDRVLRVPMAGFIPSYNLQAAVAAVSAERLRQLGGAGRREGR